MSIEQAKDKIGTVEGYDCCISLVENPRKQGELTNLLYTTINSKNNDRGKFVKIFFYKPKSFIFLVIVFLPNP